MGYIYKIVNDINDKIYIGLTVNTLKYRFNQHKTKSKRGNEDLYVDMRRYGVEHFQIFLIEECDNNLLAEREKFWISTYNTYQNGYNNSLGGEGAPTIYNHDAILKCLSEYKYNCKEIAQQFNCSLSVVYNIAHTNHIDLEICHHKNIYEKLKNNKNSKSINQYDKNYNFLQTFPSIAEAARWLFENQKCTTLNKGIKSHIRAVCNHQRDSAYGYIWKFNDN